MKKNSNKGFVLAETLVVTVFLMTIFSMIYYYFYPLIGEFEKREVYDSVDDKYSVYWIKRIIEDSGYKIESTDAKGINFSRYGYMRFECKDVPEADEKRKTCMSLVNALEVAGCTPSGNLCDIFITPYRIGDYDPDQMVNFKDTVANSDKNTLLRLYKEDCNGNDAYCKSNFRTRCINEKIYPNNPDNPADAKCDELGQTRVFDGGLQDYVEMLPDYKTPSDNGANYRIIVKFQHLTDSNNYYSYATIEVG